MIIFNKPTVLGKEITYIQDVITHCTKLSGDGVFSKKCENWFEKTFDVQKAMLTPSCTAALEMAALLIDIQPGDEVIMPSYTFVSTANAFVLRGAKIVFVDIRPDTMNIDEKKIEAAITQRTKAIVPVHYAGVACDMDVICAIADQYQLYVIEDAAQGVMASYQGKPLGSIGHLGCYSFHDTKNYTSGGEGGALLINDERFIERAEIIREKGTNRSMFLKGAVDKYTWRDMGSSYLPSELQAAYLLAQLEESKKINDRRLSIWNKYHDAFQSLDSDKIIKRPFIPDVSQQNAHMYYIKLPSLEARTFFIDEMLNVRTIHTPYHYIPLHSSPAGLKFGRMHGHDVHTTAESQKIVRLPLYYDIPDESVDIVIESVSLTLEKM